MTDAPAAGTPTDGTPPGGTPPGGTPSGGRKPPNLPYSYGRGVRRSHLEEHYAAYRRANRLGAAEVRTMREEISRIPNPPVVSLLMRVRNPDPALLRRTLDSVRAQIYPHWELRVASGTGNAETVSALLYRYTRLDRRVRLSPHAALAATGAGLVAFLGDEDELAPDALFEAVKALQGDPEAVLAYSDEDAVDADGAHSGPRFKPGHSPELLLCSDYASRLGVFRRGAVEAAGDFDGAHDLTLRLCENGGGFVHVPKVLYHRRERERPAGETVSLEAARAALARRGMGGEVEPGPMPGVLSVRPGVEGEPKVSILVPTRDNAALLRNCLEGLEAGSTYRNLEVVVVDNGSEEPEAVEYLASLSGRDGYRVVRHEGPFNYSRINNLAARHATGEYLLLLNDDVEGISPGWIEALLAHAQRPEVGAVGAKLLYPNGLVQHAGVVAGAGNFWAPGVAAHALQHYPADTGGAVGEALDTTRNCSAVTAACMMLRRSVFEEVGGLDERLTVAFNDVDLCLKIRARGYRVVYTPHAELYHYESSSRGPQRRPEENLLMRERWADTLDSDPYHNPNLSLGAGDLNLRADLLRPRSLREAEAEAGPRPETLEGEEREAYLAAQRAKARGTRRTSLVPREQRPLVVASVSGEALGTGEKPDNRKGTGVSEEQVVWMFGSPRTGSTWISGVMADLEGVRRWNEPHVGLLFGSFYYEKIGADNPLAKSPAFIMGAPHRRAWLQGIKGFVLGGAAARHPGLRPEEKIVVKEPNGAIGAPLIMEAMPKSPLIFLLRDPRDVVASWLDAFSSEGWNPASRDTRAPDALLAQTRRLAERYLAVVSRVQEAYEAHGGPKALVRYEDLRRDTFGVMSGMLAALGIPFDAAGLRAATEKHAWENVPEEEKGSGKFHRKGTPGGWREDLTPEQAAVVEEVAEPVLSRYYRA